MNDSMKKWFDITVLCTKHKSGLLKEEIVDGVRVIRSPVLFSISRAKISLLMLPTIIRNISSSDIVFVNSPSVYITFTAVWAKLFGKKLFVFHQGDLTLPKGFGNIIVERLFDLSSVISCLLADKVFCATKDYAEHSRVLSRFMNKFETLPILARKTAKPSFNTKLKSVEKLKRQGYVIFGFAGRFVEEKGFDLLLQAIPDALKKNPKIHFIFAGDLNVSYEDFFEKNRSSYEAVQKHITNAGLLDEKLLEGFYHLVDAIIIPSRSDCFPTVQVEGMIRGKPVIVTDIPGARVPVKEIGFGIIIPPDDVAAISKAIISTSKQKEELQKQYENVKNYFNFKRDEQIVKKHLAG